MDRSCTKKGGAKNKLDSKKKKKKGEESRRKILNQYSYRLIKLGAICGGDDCSSNWRDKLDASFFRNCEAGYYKKKRESWARLYIYIYIHEVCYLTEKEERKKIVCLLQELFLRFLNLCSMWGKLWVMCGWSCPFILLVRESLIAIRTHPVKARLARKRSQNKEEFLYLMEWIRHCEFHCPTWN